MYNVSEYTYENEDRHLKESDVLEQYKKAKDLYPNALVVLEDLPCGHWDVEIYKTPEQKEAFYKRKINSMLKQIKRKSVF